MPRASENDPNHTDIENQCSSQSGMVIVYAGIALSGAVVGAMITVLVMSIS